VDTGDVPINPFRHLCHKDVVLIGQFGSAPQYYATSTRLIEAASKKGYPLDKIVTHKFPLEETQTAVETHKRLECMKAVIVFD